MVNQRRAVAASVRHQVRRHLLQLVPHQRLWLRQAPRPAAAAPEPRLRRHDRVVTRRAVAVHHRHRTRKHDQRGTGLWTTRGSAGW